MLHRQGTITSTRIHTPTTRNLSDPPTHATHPHTPHFDGPSGQLAGHLDIWALPAATSILSSLWSPT